MYDPNSPSYGQYMTVADWMADHAPTQADFDLVKAWLVSEDFTVNFEATNRMVIQFSGSVADFNETFQTTLHVCLRKNPQQGNPPFEVYCTLESFTLPIFVANRTIGLLTADLPADTGNLPGEAGQVIDDDPGDGAFDPGRIAAAYDVDDLYNLGFTGEGQTVGVVAAAHYHSKDLQTFWKSFDITRDLPQPIELMEKVVTRITETILDTQWSSSMAPGADVIVYEGPDARNTSLVYVFNEAIGLGKVDVLTDSFAHREDSEPKPVRDMYDHSALMAAAIGMTVVSASGDSARPDTPCTSPYVTCIGGTTLNMIGNNVVSETAWQFSGSGENKSFAVPYWQEDVAPGTKRALVELALNADPGTGYWVRRFGQWEVYGGTSFSSPAFAGIVAVINSYRADQGLPKLGYMNPVLYQDAGVRASFRDVVLGGTDLHDAGPGWDMPTGWGAPRAKLLADAWP
jgi:kumamolisin